MMERNNANEERDWLSSPGEEILGEVRYGEDEDDAPADKAADDEEETGTTE